MRGKMEKDFEQSEKAERRAWWGKEGCSKSKENILVPSLPGRKPVSPSQRSHVVMLATSIPLSLCRSKEIEAVGCNGDAAFLEVRVQQLVIEFILNHVDQIFSNNRKASSAESIGNHFLAPSDLSLALFSSSNCIYCTLVFQNHQGYHAHTLS